MSAQRFERSVDLPASAEESWRWHARPGAFERLAPPWQQLELLERTGGPEEEGSRVTFRVRRGPISFRWTAEHRDIEPPRSFCDVQIAGPFAAWEHTHRFEPLADGGCRLGDSVAYRLPGGPLGELLAGRRIRRDLEALFAYRHAVTGGDLARHATFSGPPLRIAVSGASGLVGSALVPFLTTGGHEVLRLVRRPPRDRDEIAWDPERGALDPARLEGLDALVTLQGANLAGGRWTAQRKRVLRASRVEAIHRLVGSLSDLERPPRTLVSATAIGIYGAHPGRELPEDAPVGEGFLAELSTAWEAAAQTAAESWGARVALARFGVVLSPRGGALAKLLPVYRAGLGGPVSDGRGWFSWIALDDALGVLHHLLTQPIEGPVNAVSPHPVTQRELARTLGRVLRRPALFPVPAPMLKLVFGEMAEETILASQRVVPARLAEAGFRFAFPELEGALRHLLGRPGKS